jgi:hypothetical protein
MGSDLPGERGPMRFEEGVATDTDVPRDFGVGIAQGGPSPARPNRNQKVDTKYAEETMAERAHVGSASWITAPTVLDEFVQGSMVGDVVEYEHALNDGTRAQRGNPTVVDW